jgi:excisionase family DNA binding protein
MTNSDLPTSGYVTTRWVCERYAISNSTLYVWIKEGRLPAPIRIGPRAVRFAMPSLLEFEAKLVTATPGTEEAPIEKEKN